MSAVASLAPKSNYMDGVDNSKFWKRLINSIFYQRSICIEPEDRLVGTAVESDLPLCERYLTVPEIKVSRLFL